MTTDKSKKTLISKMKEFGTKTINIIGPIIGVITLIICIVALIFGIGFIFIGFPCMFSNISTMNTMIYSFIVGSILLTSLTCLFHDWDKKDEVVMIE